MFRAHLVAVVAVALLTACGGDPPAQQPDAAAPCGGACGPWTARSAGRCVPLEAPDAGPDVALDAPPDTEQLDAAADVALDAEGDVVPDAGDAFAYLDTAGLYDGGVVTVWADLDGDGYGNTEAGPMGRFCVAMIPARNYATRAGACNDRNPAIHAGAPEVCGNGLDENCEGHVDEGCR